MKAKMLLACTLLSGCLAAATGTPEVGKPAPKFKGKSTAGKVVDLAAASKNGPVFVYFISTTCPVSREATPFYSRYVKAFAPLGLSVIGILNDDAQAFARWNKEHKVSYSVIADPDYRIIRMYGIEQAPSCALIGKGGKLLKLWKGYSRGFLQEAITASAKALGKPAPKVDVAGAPAAWQAG